MKECWKPGTVLYPLPVVLVSCGKGIESGESNLFTVAWTGIICTNPPMLSISVRPERASYGMICDCREFTVNLATSAMAWATDFCGVKSMRDIGDKWKASGLTPREGIAVECPAVEESPLSLECKVKEIKELGSHHLFIAEIVNVIADTRFINPQSGKFELDKADLICYSHGGYYRLSEQLGHFGFSVRKKKLNKNKNKN